MKEEIEQLILSAQKELFSTELDVTLTIPPEKQFGDFSTNIAFLLSKTLKQNPKAVAEALAKKLETNPIVSKIEIAGPGFINIFINNSDFALKLIQEILEKKENYLQLSIGQNLKLSIEHTAANPNKHLHIGHLRNFAIADSLVRIMKRGGYEVEVQYLMNDQGLQIAKVVWGFMNLEKLNLGINVDIKNTDLKFDTLAAKVYVAAEKILTTDEELEKEARALIPQMEKGSNEVADFCNEITTKILLGQLQTTQDFGVYYDRIITESAMTQSGEVERVMQALLKTGKVFLETEGKNKGCIVIKNIKDQNGNVLPDKVLIREDGTAVYTGKDIVVHLWKFGLLDVNFKFNELYKQPNGVPLYITAPNNNGELSLPEKSDLHINIVDQRQSYPLEIVKQSLKTLGFEEASANFYHLGYETVVMSAETAQLFGYKSDGTEKIVAMSGRKGIEVPIDELLAKMTDFVSSRNNEKKGNTLTQEESKEIAASALRYYMTKFNYNTIIVFDINEALKSDGDSGIYLMYAYVRALGILKTNNFSNQVVTTTPENINAAATELLTTLSFAKDAVETVVKTREVTKLTEYTYNLAKLFTSFYSSVNIGKLENDEEKAFYLNLVSAFAIVYKDLLDMLGMSAPEKM